MRNGHQSEGESNTRRAAMTCYVMVECTAKKATGSVLLEVLRGELPITRTKDGCQSLELTVNQDNPDNMVIVMRWVSREHYDTYRAWREANGDLKRLGELIDGPPSTRFFDISDV
jgi:quinol monooxygenase YgiN